MKTLTIRTLAAMCVSALLGLLHGAEPGNPKTRAEPSAREDVEFSLGLARQILTATPAREMDNAVLSPIGATQILLALEAGAVGPTAAEIAKVLKFPKQPADAALPPPTEVWKSAMAIWTDASFPLLPAYHESTTKSLGATVAEAPFATEPGKARETVNAWVAENTGGKVRDFLSDRELRGAKLVLAATAWFKDTWKTPFNPELTQRAPFTLAGGKTTEALFVNAKRPAKYGRNDAAEVLVLPFANQRFEALFLLPGEGKKKNAEALREFETKLDSKTLAVLVAAATEQETEIRLPKIDFSGHSTSLVEPLKRMGVRTIFSDKADLSKMTQKGADLKISIFKQTAGFRLDETGAEAVAATAAIAVPKGAAPAPRPPAKFHATRPFLILIRDTTTGAIPFIIRCARPAPAEESEKVAPTTAK